VQGVYLNTAWGIQAETIQDEILGSSNGSANQEFKLTKLPVIAESIWVNELATLTEAQRTTLAQQTDFEVKIRKDAEDQVIEFLVRWQAIDDLAQAGPADRVYAIDRTFGLVTFGDGASHGQVPPIGKDNLKATYQSGGGARGNVPRGAIKSLRSTIPLVESALNPEAAGGGSDTEPIEKALERGPKVIKNRGRAIAAEDFEALAREASQAIGRARCLPTFDDRGKYRTGWVTVVIVPDSNEARPSPSPQLRQRVEKYLRERSANVAAFPRHIKVIPPAYVGINVLADVYPLTMDLAPQVESEAIAALQEFLHPLTGGYRNSGWDFGSFPCLSDFYRLLEEVEGVDHVDNLSLSLQATTLLGEPNGAPLVVSEDRPIDVTAPSFALVYSGEHKITVKSA
jgi:predicted phage baseplate assembly protein